MLLCYSYGTDNNNKDEINYWAPPLHSLTVTPVTLKFSTAKTYGTLSEPAVTGFGVDTVDMFRHMS